MNRYKKSIISILIITLVVILFIGGKIFAQNKGMKTYSNNNYSISLPKTWDIKEVDENIKLFYSNDIEVGSIEVYPECSYCSTISSFATNVFGMHSNLKDKEEIENGNGQKIWRLLVEYEPSAAEQEAGNSEVKEEQYFLWTNKEDKVILLYLDKEEISTEMINKIISYFTISF